MPRPPCRRCGGTVGYTSQNGACVECTREASRRGPLGLGHGRDQIVKDAAERKARGETGMMPRPPCRNCGCMLGFIAQKGACVECARKRALARGFD